MVLVSISILSYALNNFPHCFCKDTSKYSNTDMPTSSYATEQCINGAKVKLFRGQRFSTLVKEAMSKIA